MKINNNVMRVFEYIYNPAPPRHAGDCPTSFEDSHSLGVFATMDKACMDVSNSSWRAL
uniref:Uncharacterized protein n=1 Tax=Arion vulgaris TaxID=1028688 RepID=A0A0B6Y437_9EUPU